MPPSSSKSTVLTLRVPRDVGRRLSQEARRQHRTRSELARALLEAALSENSHDPREEARRQSKLASAHSAEGDALRFIREFADLRGWK